MDPHSTTQWAEIFTRLDVKAPLAPNGAAVIARRILADFLGYLHPSGNEATYKRRQRDLDRDTAELANALIAFSAFTVLNATAALRGDRRGQLVASLAPYVSGDDVEIPDREMFLTYVRDRIDGDLASIKRTVKTRTDAIREYVTVLIERDLAPDELESLARLSDQDLHLIAAAFGNAIPSDAAHRVAKALEASDLVLGEDERRIVRQIIADALRVGRR